MPSSPPGNADRVFGLDVMRALGGIIVLLAHTSFLVDRHWPHFPPVPGIDWIAVFFVLSGYLIGGLLLEALDQRRAPLHAFLDFMQRRWLRTLPNYYLFLLLNIALVHFGMAPGLLSHATPAYFVFMQNFHVPLDLFFWESWSLAVEEWFYALFPAVLFTVLALGAMRGRQGFVAVCLAFILLPVLARRGAAPHVNDLATWSLWVDKAVLPRLDAPGFGMLCAWAARQWPAGWKAVRWPALALGTGILWFALHHGYLRSPGFATLWLKGLEALGVALCLPLFSTWRAGGRLARPVKALSLITYAEYLVHMPLLYLAGRWVPHPSAAVCALRYAAFIGAVLLVSGLVYRCWELPFMRLRGPAGRWLGAKFRAAA